MLTISESTPRRASGSPTPRRTKSFNALQKVKRLFRRKK
jgi:hypothetical protein